MILDLYFPDGLMHAPSENRSLWLSSRDTKQHSKQMLRWSLFLPSLLISCIWAHPFSFFLPESRFGIGNLKAELTECGIKNPSERNPPFPRQLRNSGAVRNHKSERSALNCLRCRMAFWVIYWNIICQQSVGTTFAFSWIRLILSWKPPYFVRRHSWMEEKAKGETLLDNKMAFLYSSNGERDWKQAEFFILRGSYSYFLKASRLRNVQVCGFRFRRRSQQCIPRHWWWIFRMKIAISLFMTIYTVSKIPLDYDQSFGRHIERAHLFSGKWW
jgi:hypothetical protein